MGVPMSLKLGAAIPVLNEWRFMPAVIGQMLKFVDRCVIMRPSRSQSGATVSLTKIPDLDPRVDVLEGNWRSEAETRNAGMDYLEDCDYVFMIDSDEILLDEDLQNLRTLCEQRAHPVISVKLYTYWKTPEYVIDPPEDGTIKMVLRKDIRLYGVREVRGPVYPSEIYCHHLSYVRSMTRSWRRSVFPDTRKRSGPIGTKGSGRNGTGTLIWRICTLCIPLPIAAPFPVRICG
jgi:hypothetical protein